MLLKRHRVAAVLSQEALAARAGLSARAISDLERGAKARPHLETVRMLANALALSPAEQAELAAAARPEAKPPEVPSPPSDAGTVPVRLPIPPTPLVGRERDVERIVSLFAHGTARSVTITGPGGVGKTRLAMAVAANLEPAFPHGMVWVELAPLADPRLLVSRLSEALGLRHEGAQLLVRQLHDHLRGKRLLIVLDNCEHLRHDVADLVATMLSTHPDLMVLSTSRAPLRIRWEQIYEVLPLPVPDGVGMTLEDIRENDAVCLFIARARAIDPGFELSADNVDAIAAICRRLDGLPLAIELGAARTRMLSPAALLALLDEHIWVVGKGAQDAPAHQQTLREAIAWSYDLLLPQHQRAFRRTAVFAGSFSLDAAAAVCAEGDPLTTLEALGELIDQALLRRVEAPGRSPRFGMLETVRSFAHEELVGNGEDIAAWRVLATFLLDLVTEARAALDGPDAPNWLARLETDYDNVRAVLGWTLRAERDDPDVELGLQIAIGLWPYFQRRGYLRESNDWLERALARCESATPEARAIALLFLANIANNLEDHERARRHYQASKELWTALGKTPEMASCLVGLGFVATSEGDLEAARGFYEEALAVGQGALSSKQMVSTLYGLGQLHIAKGDLTAALSHFEQARQLCQETGATTSVFLLDVERAYIERLRGNTTRARDLAQQALTYFASTGENLGSGYCLIELGHLDAADGNVRLAAARVREAYQTFGKTDDPVGIVKCLECLVSLAAQVGRWHDAVLLANVARIWRANTRTIAPAVEQVLQDEYLERAQRNLDPVSLDAVIQEASQLSLDGVAFSVETLLATIESAFVET
jgi:predicted ATPase/transcriptional regulator with XRE-family HTH domain